MKEGEQAQTSTVMRGLSRYIAGALKRKLPADVGERAKIHIVDTVAAIVSGSRLRPGKCVLAYAKSRRGPAEAVVLGTRLVRSVSEAALANGICAHADETDDLHPPTRAHLGASIVPAVIAVSDWRQVSGTALLRAVVLGYDIAARTLLAINPPLQQRAAHHPGSKGHTLGCGAAAAALLKMNARDIRYVLSYAAQQAGGISSLFRELHHIEKAFVVCGLPAHNGVTAALMVASGFTGLDDVFHGEHNFFAAFSHDPDPEALTRGLGRQYEIMRTRIKRWSVGGPVQAPLHVLNEMQQQHRFKAQDVEKLVVRIPDNDLWVVSERTMSNISLQHLLALMLVDGGLTFRATHDLSRMKDSKLLDVRRKIQAIGDPDLATAVRGWRCAMDIELKDGRHLSQNTMNGKGGFDSAVTREEVEKKALDLMAPVLGAKRSQKLISALFDIDRISNVRNLRRLYTS